MLEISPFTIETRSKTARYEIDEWGCWIWQGVVGHKGHGRLSIGKRYYTAHRVYWEAAMGRTVSPLHLLHHTCHNPSCVNPNHLEEMTMLQHKRHHPDSRRQLTFDDATWVRLWRSVGCSQKDIAAAFGVSRGTVRDIEAGRTYKV